MEKDISKLEFLSRQRVHWNRSMRFSAVIFTIIGIVWLINGGSYAALGLTTMSALMIWGAQWTINREFNKAAKKQQG